MSLTRKSFLRRTLSALGSLLFWRSQGAVPNAEKAPILEDLWGLKHISWAIDKDLGEQVGEDPWITDDEGPGYPCRALIQCVPREIMHTVPLYQKSEDVDGERVFMTRWGEEGFSPVFKSKNHMASLDSALEWARDVPEAEIHGNGTLLIFFKDRSAIQSTAIPTTWKELSTWKNL